MGISGKVLATVLETGEGVVPYYQPKVDINTLETVGHETLARIVHPDTGKVLSPACFIPQLEARQQVGRLDDLILGSVCRQVRHWLDTGLNVLPVSVNVSAYRICDSEVVNTILRSLEAYQVPSELLAIEITETTRVFDLPKANENMRHLSRSGVTLVADDFGSGFMLREQLEKLPFTEVKLDKTIVQPCVSKHSSLMMSIEKLSTLACG